MKLGGCATIPPLLTTHAVEMPRKMSARHVKSDDVMTFPRICTSFQYRGLTRTPQGCSAALVGDGLAPSDRRFRRKDPCALNASPRRYTISIGCTASACLEERHMQHLRLPQLDLTTTRGRTI